jgi:hypothetical protein
MHFAPVVPKQGWPSMSPACHHHFGRLKNTGVESFACHPGMARTDIFRKGDHDKMATIITDWAQWLSGQTAASGALAILYCATAPELDGRHTTL